MLFTIIHDPAGDYAASYEGLDDVAVTALIAQTGFPFDFVDQATYDAFVAAHLPVSPDPAQLNLLQRLDAVALLNSGDGSVKALRSLLLALIDEVNELRQRFNDLQADVQSSNNIMQVKPKWALRLPMPARTGAGLKTIMLNKVTSGAAD